MKFLQTPWGKIDAETATNISSCRIKLYDFFPIWMNAFFQVQIINKSSDIVRRPQREEAAWSRLFLNKHDPVFCTLLFALHILDQIFFSGSQTDPCFQNKNSGCRLTGQVSLIEKFLTTASLQLDNFLETSGSLHDNNLAITLQKRQRIVFHSKLLRDR